MSDDNEQQGPSFNPFIRFKNHVDARIRTGISVFTGTTYDRDKSLGNSQPSTLDGQNSTSHHGSARAAASSPWPNRNQPPGSSRMQSSVIDYWVDWCHVDPYSPHNLHHLAQPTPRDLPSGVDPADFGFLEAFEDLMTASNPFRGHLMDLGMRAGLKRSAAGKLVQPETPSAWVRRLYGDALLPSPFIWEQPRLAGGFPRSWAARGEQPAVETVPRSQHDFGDIGDVARAYLEIMRHFDDSVDESFSKMEEIMGRDVVEMMVKARKIADKTMGVLSGERSEDHDSGSSHKKTHGGPKPASVSEEDQPDTEEDLFEMIQSASAEVDKFLSSFTKTRARQATPPADRTARDTPPVEETVEYDPSGGKTIRTSSEHVDMFGFVHCRTEVRRLNAKGETIDYDTRYSVRSSTDEPRCARARQEEYRPRSDAPVSVLMTPEQYSAFRVSTAEADGATRDPENLALTNQQMRLILREQQRGTRQSDKQEAREETWRLNSDGAARSGPNHARQDYQRQLMLLEEQNKRRFKAQAAEDEATRTDNAAPGGGEHNSQDFETELKRLEDQGKERLRRARDEKAAANSPLDKPHGKANSGFSGWFWR